MSLNDKIIFQEKFLKRSSLLLLLYFVTLFVLTYLNWVNLGFAILMTLILIVLIVIPSYRIWSFTVYDDKIELLKTFINTLSEEIRLDQIKQVRYEDSFSASSFHFFLHSYIIIYPQDDVSLKSLKKDRIVLAITGFNRRDRILKLLQFFQSKDLDVVIKTDSKKIKKGTGLRNWDQVL